MILSPTVLKIFRLNLTLVHVLGCTSFSIKTDKNLGPKIIPCDKQTSTKQWIKLALSIILVFTLFLQVLQAKGKEEDFQILESTLYASSLFAFAITNAAYLSMNKFVSEFLNCLIQFEKREPDMMTGSTKDKWIVNYGQFNGLIAAPIFGLPYAIQRWLSPCNSATFAWYILEECLTQPIGIKLEPNSIILLSITSVFSMWLIFYLIGAFAFYCAGVFYVTSYCIVNYLINFRIVLENCEVNRIEKVLKKYRQLQIFERHLNSIHQNVIITVMLNPLILGVIISAYSLINLGSQLSIPHLILFSSILIINITAIVLLCGTLGLVHTESTITLAYLDKTLITRLESEIGRSAVFGKFNLKFIKRFVASLYVLKVRIGNANFVEKTTPMVVLEFCVEQIVNLLLMN
ncbi:unnamed protein product [Orchesella dallaii]|uniref:Odorant receptor n=1 Tax=Orchesella dallaii TaxID=48710 RepID=A0ABP1R8E0_9HEXA